MSADFGDESTEPRGVLQPLRIPSVIPHISALLMLLSDELVSCSESFCGCISLSNDACLGSCVLINFLARVC